MIATSCGIAAAPVVLPDPFVDEPLASTPGTQSIVLAGGCFWGVQAVFQHVKGVRRVTSGYAGGDASTAHYETVAYGDTGHAEAVDVVYDPSQITLGQILKVFFGVAHDPTQAGGQGPDRGMQYRSAIFVATPQQRHIAEAYVEQLRQVHAFVRPIMTKLEDLIGFYEAEKGHQDYARQNPDDPYILANDTPKVAALKQAYPQLYVNP